MKYYLNINGAEYKNVSALQIGQKYRAESVKQNLSGGYLIDRMGGEKITLTASLNMLSDAELTALRAAVAAISCEVIFDRGATRTTKTMRVLPFTEPSPIYYYGDKSKGIMYGSIRLTMEEM
jgi:hypothetical protein